MFAALVDVILGLWWAAIASTTAAILAMRAVWFGVVPRLAGAITAVGIGIIAASYWCDIADVASGATLDMRRGASVILWPAIGWVVGVLIAQSRNVAEVR